MKVNLTGLPNKDEKAAGIENFKSSIAPFVLDNFEGRLNAEATGTIVENLKTPEIVTRDVFVSKIFDKNIHGLYKNPVTREDYKESAGKIIELSEALDLEIKDLADLKERIKVVDTREDLKDLFEEAKNAGEYGVPSDLVFAAIMRKYSDYIPADLSVNKMLLEMLQSSDENVSKEAASILNLPTGGTMHYVTPGSILCNGDYWFAPNMVFDDRPLSEISNPRDGILEPGREIDIEQGLRKNGFLSKNLLGYRLGQLDSGEETRILLVRK